MLRNTSRTVHNLASKKLFWSNVNHQGCRPCCITKKETETSLENSDENNTLSSTDLKKLLKPILAKHKITIDDLESKVGSVKGDGYMGNLTNVNVKCKKTQYHLTVKCAPVQDNQRRALSVREKFMREILFYDSIFPILLEFQKERTNKVFLHSVVKYYGHRADDMKETVVMEDVRSKGYKMWQKGVPLSDAHLNVIFKELGKFHAISYALKDQRPASFRNLAKQLPDVRKAERDNPKLKEGFLRTYENVVDMFKDDNDTAIHDCLVNFQGKIFQVSKDAEEYYGDQSVITHGDYYSNNIMFKYKDKAEKLPDDIILLDFQLLAIGHPVKDLSYAFYISAGDQETLSNLDKYLRIYYRSLKKHFEELCSNPQNLITFDELKSEWKKFGRYGFMHAIAVVKITLMSPEEVQTLSERMGNEAEFEKLHNQPIRREEEYRRRLRNIAFHMYENGFLSD